MEADIIFYNGIIYPVIPEGKTYEALAVKDKKIQFVGAYDLVKHLIGDKTKVYDIKGQMLLPGFIDTHAHLLDTGLSQVLLNFKDIKSISELIDIIKVKEGKIQAGEWIKGVNLDENFLTEKRLPTKEELDYAAPNNPVYINYRSYHGALVNSLALELLELDKNTQGYEQSSSGNYVSGVLTMEANSIVKQKISELVSDVDLEKGYQQASIIAASVGLTTIHCIEGGEYWSDVYPDYLLNVEYKTFEPIVYFNTKDIEKIKIRGLTRMGGDIFVDGSIGDRSAALFDDYSDAQGNKGTILSNQDNLEKLIKQAHLENIQISFHAIGDRAIEKIITAFETVITTFPQSVHRHRIEHFGMPLPEHMLRAKRLGLAIAVQPAFTYQKECTYIARLGKERFSRAYPLRDLVNAGLLIGGGSDSMVSPLDPIFGIHAAVNAPNIEQRLTVEEAIKLYTIWAAALAFEENMKGSLEEGKYADLVILQEDIRFTKSADIKNIKVTGTVFRGEVVY